MKILRRFKNLTAKLIWGLLGRPICPSCEGTGRVKLGTLHGKGLGYGDCRTCQGVGRT